MFVGAIAGGGAGDAGIAGPVGAGGEGATGGGAIGDLRISTGAGIGCFLMTGFTR